ncbi:MULTISPECIES: tRNA (adenosine(37)-N6)-threonylcarbamoyltransferase complex ATPase subunit type 1 TsaE [Marichromatium]|uniref:tRNA threonylcarbamoyladenosine biosynthesis protein TsaE n=1 Tax=Marichromatium gracile TaxID=1048 RepID=A0A4R4AA71_MARGR|nr:MULTISPECIES: tRNA (adenosine(37)-N6)-threonylcarbamoyltransferase complex ATPase subunit type 1 TsaE [Marichromatium]MBO8087120.1 tRNA (adenosine(37)-N6)-threonylcarbamoyltransferase complex ATPase subunit type 1 TsaE [Marichromatium sp.]MBK1708162.1 tRNA (adenosine(37)-N6)-threonylcarbamoyltransferase complex ATPase subunit type 1 TsaE [Marichromatium gracile]RNE89603.1 tRNA (adenosine(37)-N6)-threonylcarbamoyltransferase complex ATPase subunit type 1 TsaE [Marichromatium sp. AB31]RNE94681
MHEIHIAGEAAQLALGARLAERMRAPFVLYLQGDLGCGKTTLTRGLLRALGHQGAVRSPTYTLIEPYVLATTQLYHLDLYRLADPEELEYLGLRDLLETPAIWVVEWPQCGAGALPPPDLQLQLEHRADGRSLRPVATTEAGLTLARALYER